MSWRLTDPRFLKGFWKLNNNALDYSGYGKDGTVTGAVYIEGPYGKSVMNFDGTDDKVAVGDVYNGIKSVSFFCNPDTTTEQFMELASGLIVTVNAGTIVTTGWTSPTVYVNTKISSTLIADNWQHVVVVSDTGINANAVNFGVESTNFGDTGLFGIRFYSCRVTGDEVITLNRLDRM